jgi:hypothetical protein
LRQQPETEFAADELHASFQFSNLCLRQQPETEFAADELRGEELINSGSIARNP